MIRDITIGQYYPAQSILHRLDPRVKLVGTLLYLISLFLFNSIPGLSGGHHLPCGHHTHVKGTFFLYHEGHEAHYHAADDHGCSSICF